MKILCKIDKEHLGEETDKLNELKEENKELKDKLNNLKDIIENGSKACGHYICILCRHVTTSFPSLRKHAKEVHKLSEEEYTRELEKMGEEIEEILLKHLTIKHMCKEQAVAKEPEKEDGLLEEWWGDEWPSSTNQPKNTELKDRIEELEAKIKNLENKEVIEKQDLRRSVEKETESLNFTILDFHLTLLTFVIMQMLTTVKAFAKFTKMLSCLLSNDIYSSDIGMTGQSMDMEEAVGKQNNLGSNETLNLCQSGCLNTDLPPRMVPQYDYWFDGIFCKESNCGDRECLKRIKSSKVGLCRRTGIG
jgi:hypothetical protein